MIQFDGCIFFKKGGLVQPPLPRLDELRILGVLGFELRGGPWCFGKADDGKICDSDTVDGRTSCTN